MRKEEYGNDPNARTAIRDFDAARAAKMQAEQARRERLFRIKCYLTYRKKRAAKPT